MRRFSVEYRVIIHVDAKDDDDAVDKAADLLYSSPDPHHILWDSENQAVWEDEMEY